MPDRAQACREGANQEKVLRAMSSLWEQAHTTRKMSKACLVTANSTVVLDKSIVTRQVKVVDEVCELGCVSAGVCAHAQTWLQSSSDWELLKSFSLKGTP